MLILACLVVVQVTALSPRFFACQVQKPTSVSPLQDCPDGTIFVSQNDARAQYSSVQEAILSLPETGNATILIASGEYHETVNVSRAGPLTLLGQLPPNTTLEVAENATSLNVVQIWNNQFVQTGMDDAQSAVLTVSPSFNASLIGAGTTGAPLQPLFGNVDFKAYNIDFQNRAANFSISQALVTDISYANASFYGCSFASYQDTWYTGRNASTYVVDSIVFGMTDYIFGFGTAWFQNVTLANRGCGGGIVAWKGTNASGPSPVAPGNRYGAYIADSTIIRSPDASATTVTEGACFLGRPWNDDATTVFLRTWMDNSIQPAGFTPFDAARPIIKNTTFYAEFDSTGPGGNTSSRVPSDHILSAADARNFTIDRVFSGRPQWIDFDYTC
ncbi:carbohydrate esterase family 8 protein [Plicaturopsis crispa FD-325 SS-3]|nr:carbohydrate esterase family 8 protein [Plicaturopsis crispa FD-325 SS-3]